MDGIVIRPLGPEDSLAELTELLHRAYAPLAARGLRYVASWQDERITGYRIEDATCFVAVDGDRLVGTVTVKRPRECAGCAWLAREDVAVIGQFAVEPALQGRGIGAALLAAAERRAAEEGFAEAALDTAEAATELIAWYAARGYRPVGRADWDATNYLSVVMSKTLKT
jgi:GNAT superfamily N-acetyltransferase